MEQFTQFLQKKRIATPKQRPYFVKWVLDLNTYCKKKPGEPIEQDDINRFLSAHTDQLEDWQMQQAQDAIRLYIFFQNKNKTNTVVEASDAGKAWSEAIDQMVTIMRLKHMAYSTEQTYLNWMRQFYRYLQGLTPKELSAQHVIDFLTYLAVERKVAKSTQNQAFNSVLFFFRHVLNKEIGDLWLSVRSKKKQRIPVVFSRDEVQRLIGHMGGKTQLMAKVIYGGGLRSTECVRLRVKDLDFDRQCTIIRSGKGDKDRETLLPEIVIEPLKKHLRQVKAVYEADRTSGVAGVSLPHALDRKYPAAATQWKWF
jgi:integrase